MINLFEDFKELTELEMMDITGGADPYYKGDGPTKGEIPTGGTNTNNPYTPIQIMGM